MHYKLDVKELIFIYSETKSHYITLAALAGLELTEIYLPLTPKCWNYCMFHHTWPLKIRFHRAVVAHTLYL